MESVARRFPTTTSSLLYMPKQLQVSQKLPQRRPTLDSVAVFEINQRRKLLETRLVSMLDGCTSLSQVKQVYGHILGQGLDQCCYVITKAIRTLTKLDVPMESYPSLIFHRVRRRNPFLWTAMIRGYLIQDQLEDAVASYGLMRKEETGPVSFTYSALFKACSEKLDVSLGRQIHAQTISVGGFVSDLYVGNTLIDMYVKCGALSCARKVFDEMPDRDVISWTELIAAYAKCGDMGAASELFDGLPVKDMVAWTAMVTGYAQNAKPREALQFFERMQGLGIETDDVTLVGVISACAQLGAAKYANWIRDIAENSGYGSRNHVVVGSALIDMYSKCGNVEEAYNVFKLMEEKNVFSYSSMIVGFAIHGRPHAALDLFHEMVQETSIKPNRVTFVGVLSACSHAGMVEQGRQIFASMHKDFGVEPSADHYTCMVDLLGRVGKLNEALELVESMPIEPHGGVWGALLGACRIHNNPDIAEIAAEHLFKLEPNEIGNYVLLSNIFASAGKWDGVSSVRKMIKSKGLKKNPASSWVEEKKGLIHEFFAGDSDHPRFIEIKQTLKNLLDRLETIGYQANLSSVPYDVSDDEKKRILMNHSEKQALAFALLSTSSDSTIRIVKNLRICEDCHLFMCGASQVTGREIIVRDNTRFHHFHDGTCSCGNFW